MKRIIHNEQFFTTEDNARFCISKLGDLSRYSSIIEPSAGDGSFSKRIENCIAMDIAPMDKSIVKQDYLAYSPNVSSLGDNALVIGNPPFGRQSSLAVKFINKSATFAKKIAFILAKSFKKESMLSRLNKHVFLSEVFELPDDYFYFNETKFYIPCSYFIFDVRNEERSSCEIYSTSDFTFVRCPEEADDAIRRVGYYAGRIEPLSGSPTTHYFVKWNTDYARDTYMKINFHHDNTVGPRSVSKNEIIKEYLKQLEE